MLSDLYNRTKLGTRGLSGPLQQSLASHYTIHWNKNFDPLKLFSHHFGLQQVSHLTDGENEALGFMFNWGPLRVTTSSSAIKGLIHQQAEPIFEQRYRVWFYLRYFHMGMTFHSERHNSVVLQGITIVMSCVPPHCIQTTLVFQIFLLKILCYKNLFPSNHNLYSHMKTIHRLRLKIRCCC